MASYFVHEKNGRKDGIKDISFDNIAKKKVLETVQCMQPFNNQQCEEIENRIDKLVHEADEGKFKQQTVDRAPLRTKYFFGEGYSYGGQLKIKGPGQERLYPKGEVDPIPSWIKRMIIRPLEDVGILPPDWTNSAVVNDYLPGGCIVSHVDPPQLFDRPIITVSFHSDSAISFGCKFSFKPIQVSEPVARVPLSRGCVLSMGPGYSTDEITHCIRPEDVKDRRSVVILRHVPDTAPRMTERELEDLRRAEPFFKQGKQTRDDYHTTMRRNSERKYIPTLRRKSRPRSRSKSRLKESSMSISRERSKRNYGDNREREERIKIRETREKAKENDEKRQRERVVSFQSSKHLSRGHDSSSPSSRENSLGRSSGKSVNDRKSKPSIPGFIPKKQPEQEKEDGELSSDEKVEKTVTEIMKPSTLDKEEAAFQKRLEKLKANLSHKIENGNEMDDISNIETACDKDCEANEITAGEERKKCTENPVLRSEVSQLKKELKELKEVIGKLTSKSNVKESGEVKEGYVSSDDETNSVNVVDIISKEVRTTILSKNKETKITKATYLKIKAERKENLLKSKLIELRQRSSYSEFKKSTKSQRYRKWNSSDSDSEDHNKANSLLDVYRKRLERKMRDKIKQNLNDIDDSHKQRGRKSRDHMIPRYKHSRQKW